MRKDYENAMKKIQDFDMRAKRKQQQGKGDDGAPLSESRDIAELKKSPPAVMPRPGSRGNPLAPIKQNTLVLAKPE